MVKVPVDSQAYTKMEMTGEYISFTFDLRGMFLSLRIGFGFVRDTVACTIPERTSDFEPFCERTAPRYFKHVTVSSF